MAKETGSPVSAPGREPEGHSWSQLPKQAHREGRPLYRLRTAKATPSLVIGQEISAHRAAPPGVWVTSQGSPHTLGLEQMGTDHPAPQSQPGSSTGWRRRGHSRRRDSEKRRAGSGGGQGRWVHLPNSVRLKTQSSLRTDTAAAVSLSFE